MKPDFLKSPDGLLPAIIQDAATGNILMLGYMNEAAFAKTMAEGTVTFYSRSRKRLWTKGETSGNFLRVKELKLDCDGDTLLIKATPEGPVCHTGAESCFGTTGQPGFLSCLEQTIGQRKTNPEAGSYVSSLFSKGINKIAQKVGEEAVELVIEAKDTNDELFLDEAADLLFHYLVLLSAKGYRLADVEQVLSAREKKA